jgi:vancomycin resistance protein YoaR
MRLKISFKKEQQKVSNRPKQAGAILILIFLLLLSASIITFIFMFNGYYKNKIFPGTRVGSLDLGGMEYQEGRSLLETKANSLVDKGLKFVYEGEQFIVKSTVEDPANPELSSRLFSFDIDKTIQQIRDINFQLNEAEHIYYWLAGWQASPSLEVDEEKIVEALQVELAQYEQPAINAALVIDQDYNMSVSSEKGGQAFNYNKIISAVRHNLRYLSDNSIEVSLEQDNPEIMRTAAEPALGLVQQVLEATPYLLNYEDFSWAITKEHIQDWLEFKNIDNKITIGINSEKIADYFVEMAKEINVEVKEAKFVMENGKVVEFQPSQNGRSLQINQSLVQVNEKIRQVGIKEIDLVVEEIEPETTTENVNDLGIRGLIGEGSSNFWGSPRNRRHNIAVGADTLNGILIEPGEEFSLVEALGEVEASTGYLPELVIKGNKTIPEYGGGLCQIGTTAFRVALDAGFPITARKNHSYRVSYYEPAGTDATIYSPQPDFKFINDTEYHVLFNTEISGNELIFRFYGTSDGRKVEQTNPRIFNSVRPGPTKLVETTDLAPGQKKCTERAHTGADTEFTRTITYADGEKKVEVFRSHYKPWQEVCLIGVEELSEETAE